MSREQYTLYKGLQRPLELFGLKGKFIWIAVGAIGASLLLFIIVYIVFSSPLFGLILSASTLLSAVAWIIIKQKKGLHDKKEEKGGYIVNHLIHID